MKEITPVKPENSPEASVKKQSRLKETWHRLCKNKGAVIGMIIIILLILTALGTTFFLDYQTHVTKNGHGGPFFRAERQVSLRN